jgi:hypothetical protein
MVKGSTSTQVEELMRKRTNDIDLKYQKVMQRRLQRSPMAGIQHSSAPGAKLYGHSRSSHAKVFESNNI